jgi:hypothetical protein
MGEGCCDVLAGVGVVLGGVAVPVGVGDGDVTVGGPLLSHPATSTIERIRTTNGRV